MHYTNLLADKYLLITVFVEAMAASCCDLLVCKVEILRNIVLCYLDF
jgi:hypothetical protein